MTNESVKPSSHDGSRHKQLDHEIKDMFSTITDCVADLQKSDSVVHHEDEDEHGVRIVTLAGTNTGATLRSELDRENNKPAGLHGGPAFGEPDGLNTYVNSNFQAVNNSLMMDGSYTTNDPGVHVDITDQVAPHGHHKPDKHGWKGKKKEKERKNSHSDQHQEHDDD